MKAAKKYYFLVLGVLVLCSAASASEIKAVDLSNQLKPDLIKNNKKYYLNRKTGQYVQYQHNISIYFPNGFDIGQNSWYKQWEFRTPDGYTIAKSYFIVENNYSYGSFKANLTFYWLDKFKVVGANMVFWKNSISCGYADLFSIHHLCIDTANGEYPPNSDHDGNYVVPDRK